MQTKTEVIDLKKAKLYLERNIEFESGVEGTNRPVSATVINNYAKAMLRGKWQHTHQGLGFDTNGNLKDGQQRLRALIQAAETGAWDGENLIDPDPKIKISFQVTYGLDPKTFSVMDTGRSRDAKQALAMAGFVSHGHLSAAARLLYLFDNHEYAYWSKIKVTNDQIIEVVSTTTIQEHMETMNRLVPAVSIVPSAATVGSFVTYRALPSGPHEKFIDALSSGIGLNESDDPRLVFRNYLIRHSRTKGQRRNVASMHLALYIKAWNDFVEGRRRSNILWKPGIESFPVPVEKG